MSDYTLHHIARSLGMSGQPMDWTWDRLLDGAVVAYWRNRRPQGWRCAVGSAPGYARHRRAHELPCDRCCQAAAMVKRIQRLRARRAA